MTTPTLIEMAGRAEKASGPDRELDLLIQMQVDPEYAEIEPAAFGFFVNHGAHPEFTASLDAAMTLVPEGWGFIMASNPDDGGAFTAGVFPNEGDDEGYHVIAATPALALVAACLRARASQGGE